MAIYCLNPLKAQTYDCTGRDYLIWDSQNKLNWDCFKGKQSQDNEYKAFHAVSDIVISIQGKAPNYRVICMFDINGSWVQKGTDELLDHEQLHFDIGELTARQMRKEMDSLNAAGLTEASLEDFKQMHWERYLILSTSYDLRTRHGRNKRRQAEWRARIDAALIRLRHYTLELN